MAYDFSKFESIEAAADFWDMPSVADYDDQIHKVEIDVRAQRRRITLAPEVWERVASEARVRGVSPETLANLWLMGRTQN